MKKATDMKEIMKITRPPREKSTMNNPGIDLAVWERLKNKWSKLDKQGHKLTVEFRLVANPKDDRDILAIDVIQNADGEIVTETVQRKAGEAYPTLGIEGLSKEGLLEVTRKS